MMYDSPLRRTVIRSGVRMTIAIDSISSFVNSTVSVFSDIMYNTIIQNNAIRQMARQIIDAGY